MVYINKNDEERVTEYEGFSTIKNNFKEIFDGIINVEKNNTNNENANMSSDTPAGQMMKFASETSKDYALKYLVTPKYADAHKEGYIHIHDLDYYPTKTTTCVQYDLKELFEEGFHTKYGFIRPAKRIDSRATLATIIFQTNQNEQHGGQAIPAFDFAMAGGVLKTFKDKFTEQINSLKTGIPEVSYIINKEVYSINLTDRDILNLRDLLDISLGDLRTASELALIAAFLLSQTTWLTKAATANPISSLRINVRRIAITCPSVASTSWAACSYVISILPPVRVRQPRHLLLLFGLPNAFLRQLAVRISLLGRVKQTQTSLTICSIQQHTVFQLPN